MKTYLFCYTIVITVCLCAGYKMGAPTEVCKDMIPQHGLPPKPLPSPYTIKVDKTKVAPGGKVVVTILSDKEPSFKGFLVQARENSNSNATGSFTPTSHAKTIDCGAKGSKVTLSENG